MSWIVPYLSIGMQALGAASSVSAAYKQGIATRNAYNYKAAEADNNATIAEYQAENALDRGQRAVQEVKHEGAQTKGKQRSSMAARGIDIGSSDSALAVLAGTDYLTALKANTATDDAANEAWASRERARGLRADASMLRDRANSEDPGGDAARTFLTQGATVAAKWYEMKQKGAFG